MTRTTASQIVKEIIWSNESLSPFHADFDKDLLSKEIKLEIEKIDQTKTTISNIETVDKIIQLCIVFNSIYEELLNIIINKFSEINLDNIALIEAVLKQANFTFCSVAEDINNSEMKHSSFKLEKEILLTSIWGEKIASTDALDVSVDAANELCSLILTYNRNGPHKKFPVNSDEYIIIVTQKIVVYANIIFIIKDTFNAFLNEFFEIQFVDESIKFAYDTRNYFILKQVGKLRYKGHLTEPYIYFGKKILYESITPHISITKGLLGIELTSERHKNMYSSNSGVLSNYFFI